MALTPGQRRARRMWRARAIAWEDGMNGATSSPAAALLGGLDGVAVVHASDSMAYRSGGGALDYDDVRETGATAVNASANWVSGTKLPITSGNLAVYTKGTLVDVSNSTLMEIYNNASPTANSIFIACTGGGDYYFRVISGGTTYTAPLSLSVSLGVEQEISATVDFATGRLAYCVDGGTVRTNTLGAISIPTGLDRIAFGKSYFTAAGYQAASGDQAAGAVILRATALSDAELQAGPPWS